MGIVVAYPAGFHGLLIGGSLTSTQPLVHMCRAHNQCGENLYRKRVAECTHRAEINRPGGLPPGPRTATPNVTE